MEQLATAFGDQILHFTSHIEKMFPPTELSRWMDTVGDHMGTWWHRVKHGHDICDVGLVYKKFGAEGVLQFPFELGKDCLIPHGIPLPGVQSLHLKGYVNAKTATEWLSFNVGDVLGGCIAIYSTFKLMRKTRASKLSKRDVIWASIGCITKVTAGIVSQHLVMIITSLTDGVIILDDQLEIKSKLSEFLGEDVNSVLDRAFKASATGALAGGLAAAGAFSATATFASASTGTAIASLSGVAVTKSAFSVLGGGALSAGGFGIFGGIVALSGGTAIVAIASSAYAWKRFSRH